MYIHIAIINDLKPIFKHLIYPFIYILSFTSVYAQNFELKIHSKDSSNNATLKSLTFLKSHKSKQSIVQEIEAISKKIALKGFLNNNYLLTQKDSIFNCQYTLNNKVDFTRVNYKNKLLEKHLLNQLSKNYTDTYFEILTSEIENTLNSIVNYYESKGASFTTASLKNIIQKNNKLAANLELNISKNRKINSIVIKGYANFPKKYLTHYLNLKPNALFNLNSLLKINKLVNTIPFVTQLKKPEVLFTKDSTTLFLYLEKKSTNKFDGIIGFSNENNNNNNNNKLAFNGYLDLNLNNIFNKGQTFSLNWKNNGNDTQTLKLKFKNPFVFNSRYSTSGEFSIFKQDSTYINSKSLLQINYSINRNNSINAILTNENSNLTSTIDSPIGIEAFKNTFIGASYTYKNFLKIQNNGKPTLFINIGYLIGNSNRNNLKNHQNKVQLSATYLFDINYKNSIFIKNTTEILNTANPLQNELFRIGGTNSIRGFDEQSIFTSKYSVTNIEYHYNINQTSHIYSVTDFAISQDSLTKSTSKLFGIGLGYYFNTNYSIFNLSYVIGKNSETHFNLNNSKIHIKATYPF